MKAIKLGVVSMVMLLVLSGCWPWNTRDKEVYVDRYVPIPYVPTPPKVERPEYYASTLTEEQRTDIGELAKAYVISTQELKNYASNLELVIGAMIRLAELSQKRLAQLESMGEEVDKSYLSQLDREINDAMNDLLSAIGKNDKKYSKELNDALLELSRPDKK